MDFKTAQAMKAQKLTEQSKRANITVQKGTGEKPTQTSDNIMLKTAMSAPKKEVTKGIHKADPKVAPNQSGDFSQNEGGGDQSTENNPEASGITYESHGGDQSTENNPEESNIAYETHNGDQSTENNPEESNAAYETYEADQSTENNPEGY
eukprot:TRINITY_DN337_c0_g1_i2.p1 TRINITY_DN337_c0_g1~~TRINITY_DN337_c0_g1_i2.p1  ORF type:complete len:172 (+),score=50.76 TRINITY_DN337_c0_g1_i2:64-516(+)